MKLCQLEFKSIDTETSLRFLGAVLGWTKVPVSIQDQIIIEVPDDSPYGISIRLVKEKASASQGLLAYFESAIPLIEQRDIIMNLGGRILSEPKIVTGYGQVMIAEDGAGLTIGLYEAKFEGPRPQ